MFNFFQLITLFTFLLHFSGSPKLQETFPKPQEAVINTEEIVIKEPRVENEEFIPWIASRRLTWDDFQCEPKRNTDAVASTSTSLGISYRIKNSKLSYEVTCNFSKVKSWGLIKTNYILAHEQAHFDITEIFARRLHQALQDFIFNSNNFTSGINSIYQRIVDEKEAFQQAYDRETDHSRKKPEQLLWLLKIQTILEDTEIYADYP